jgi:hypothetical protein
MNPIGKFRAHSIRTEGNIFVDPHGQIRTLAHAIQLVTATRKTIVLAPGDYVEDAPVNWPTLTGVTVLGAGGAAVTRISSLTGTKVIQVTPGLQTSSFTGILQGVELVHDLGSQSGIRFDNTAMTKKLGFNIIDCLFSPDDGEVDKSIDVAVHADADNSIRIYVQGKPGQNEIGGVVYFVVNNLADRLHLEHCWLVGGAILLAAGAIQTTNVAKELRVRLFKCIGPTNCILSGGNATQVVTCLDCFSWTDYDDNTPEVFAQLDSSDLIGSHSEVIVD